MTDIQIEVSHEILPKQIGLIKARGYINNEGGQVVADAVSHLMDQGIQKILIDLKETTIINSIGVSILLEIMERLLDNKGRLAFANLRPTIQKTFEIMGLDQYSSIHSTQEEAVDALSSHDAG